MRSARDYLLVSRNNDTGSPALFFTAGPALTIVGCRWRYGSNHLVVSIFDLDQHHWALGQRCGDGRHQGQRRAQSVASMDILANGRGSVSNYRLINYWRYEPALRPSLLTCSGR